jgi:hypothetical protein
MQLKQQALALASSWQFDLTSDRFPDFIMGESHVLGDLEIDIERWFNEVCVLTDGLIGGSHSTSFFMYLQGIARPERVFGGLSTRTGYLQNITEAFDFAFRELKKIPFRDEEPDRKNLAPSSAPTSPNTAFILSS